MADLIQVLAGGLAALAGLTTALGAWSWWQVRHSRVFWIALRATQALAVALAAAAGVAAALGRDPDDGLFWVYALIPVAVSFVAEQFRALSAQAVLDQRELPDPAAVGRLEEAEQRSVVVAVLRREAGVMTVAAAVIVFLALRALGTAAGL